MRREEKELTREHVAHEAGITTSSLARIELGQADPRWTTVRDVAKVLRVSMADLSSRASR
jgi:DNA-binding XRE family transcriptional regulator